MQKRKHVKSRGWKMIKWGKCKETTTVKYKERVEELNEEVEGFLRSGRSTERH